MHFPTDRTSHTTYGPAVDYWFEQKLSQTANGTTEQDNSMIETFTGGHSTTMCILLLLALLNNITFGSI